MPRLGARYLGYRDAFYKLKSLTGVSLATKESILGTKERSRQRTLGTSEERKRSSLAGRNQRRLHGGCGTRAGL